MRNGPIPFVIMAAPRSGSGWLVDLLDHHPSIVAYEELFRVGNTTVPRHGAKLVPRFELTVGPSTFSTAPGLAMRRYRYLRGLARSHPAAGAVGFKLIYDHVRDHPGIIVALVAQRARFIHLVRRDLLSSVVSFDIALSRDRWHYYQGSASDPLSFSADITTLVSRLREREQEIDRLRRRLRRLPVPVHEVAYEDLVERQEEVLRGLTDFLGVPPSDQRLRSELVRTTTKRTADLLDNRDEVRAALADTEYRWLTT
jgi:LPS sulfotransferase NodH